jgi:D-inositol-3-phosphate glycosyltransferase
MTTIPYRRTKILFVLTHYYPYIGGAEEAFRRIAEGLAQRGHKVVVVTTRLPGTPKNEVVNGVHIQRVDIPRLAYQFLFTFFSFFTVLRYARDCDVMHVSSNYSALVGSVVGKLLGKPVLFTCHEVLGERWNMVQKSLKAVLYRLAEAVAVHLPYNRYVAVSDATRNDLLRAGIRDEKVSVVYWGLDQLFSAPKYTPEGKLRERCGIRPDEFMYVYYGRPGMTKGVGYLIQAAQQIRVVVPNSHLVMILAEEPIERYRAIRRLVTEMGMEGYVHFVPSFPERADLARHLVDADCIVIPSLTEGFGLTTVEACTLGVPVVATRVGPIPQLVFGKYVLTPPASPQGIVEGVTRVNNGQVELRAMRPAFTWAQTIKLYEENYLELLPHENRSRVHPRWSFD